MLIDWMRCLNVLSFFLMFLFLGWTPVRIVVTAVITNGDPKYLWECITTHWLKLTVCISFEQCGDLKNAHRHTCTSTRLRTHWTVMGRRPQHNWCGRKSHICIRNLGNVFHTEIRVCCCLTQAVLGARDVVTPDSLCLRGQVWVNL